MMNDLSFRRVLSAALFLVLGSELAALPQGPPPTPVQSPRDTRPTEAIPVGTATVSGSVTVADSGQPARKVRVSLSGSEMRGRTAMTDDGGKFAFIALPAGRYTLSASKPGHVAVTYGQRRPGPGRPGTPIQLADGQKLQVHLQIPRGGVITGAVLDENGEAVPGTQVRALRYAMQNGARVIQQGGSGATDDRGIYRIYGLQPGEYIVAATPRNMSTAVEIDRMQAEVAATLEMRTAAAARAGAEAEAMAARLEHLRSQLPSGDQPIAGYAPVYYPGTTLPGSAGTIAVGVGEEKVGVDFQLQLVPIARVEGVIVNSNGPMPQNVQLTLVSTGHDVPGVGNNSTRADANGRFRFSNVGPGQYMLIARATLGGGRGGGRGEPAQPATPVASEAARRMATQAQAETVRLWATTDIGVDGRDVQNLVLTLQPGMTVSGRIAFEGTSPIPADLSRLRVNVSPVSVQPGVAGEFASNLAGRVDTTGRFTVTGVVPGRYRVTASGTQGWRMSSSILSGQDTLDFPVEVKPSQNVSGVVVTLTDKEAELTGAIVDEKGQPAPDYTIILYAADREFWTPNSRRIFSQRPGTDGQFTFRNMPPGDYRIAPVLDPEPGTWFDPGFLQQLDSNALRVLIGAGEKKVQNLRISVQ